MISIIIPTYNDEKDLNNCLKSLHNQNFRDFEVIIGDSESTDSTREIAKRFGAKISIDKKHIVAGGMNAAIEKASGDILVTVDADCTFPEDFLQKIKSNMEEDIDVLGGEDIIKENSTDFEKAVFQIDLAKMEKTPIYGKKACYRQRGCNMAYKSEIFKNHKFYDKTQMIQETELNHRLIKEGKKFKFNPNLIVYHKRRNNLKGVFKQIYRNGISRGIFIKIHKDAVSLMDLFPPTLIVYIISMILLSFNNILFLYAMFLSFILYLISKPFYILSKTKKFKYYPKLLKIIATRELAFSIGFIKGLLSKRGK